MGCWNETCAISRLPILAGDRIVLLMVEPGHWFDVPEYDPKTHEPLKDKPVKRFWSGYVEPNVLLEHPTKVIRILRGTYDDYGWIEEYKREDYNYEGNEVTDPGVIIFREEYWDAALEWFEDSMNGLEKRRMEDNNRFLDHIRHRIKSEKKMAELIGKLSDSDPRKKLLENIGTTAPTTTDEEAILTTCKVAMVCVHHRISWGHAEQFKGYQLNNYSFVEKISKMTLDRIQQVRLQEYDEAEEEGYSDYHGPVEK